MFKKLPFDTYKTAKNNLSRQAPRIQYEVLIISAAVKVIKLIFAVLCV